MKLLEVYPLTIVGLRAWPNPTKGIAHSGIEQVDVKGPNDKIKLKQRKKGKPLFNKLGEQLDEQWTKEDDSSYTTEMSDLSNSGEGLKCPACHQTTKPLPKKIDREGEITHWSGNCSNCHTKLTIFND
jgi:ssDNA-binding Zn-finger/Zn-ribbon topoisomerase 1